MRSSVRICAFYLRTVSPPLESRRPCQYLRAIPLFGTAIPLWLGRVSWFVLRLTQAHDRDASDRFLPPNTLLTSTRTWLLPVHRQSLRFACTRRVAPTRTEESNVSRRPNRFGGSPGLVVDYSSSRVPRIRFRFLRRPTSDTPVAPLSLLPCAVFAAIRLGDSRQDRFHSEHRDALEDFPIQGAFPR